MTASRTTNTNLDCVFLKAYSFTLILFFLKGSPNRIELVTRPGVADAAAFVFQAIRSAACNELARS